MFTLVLAHCFMYTIVITYATGKTVEAGDMMLSDVPARNEDHLVISLRVHAPSP